MTNQTCVCDLDLPGRTKVALIRAGYTTVGQLRPLLDTPEGFLVIPGIGYKGAGDIRYLLQETIMETAPETNTGEDFYEADRPLTKDERLAAIAQFCTWFIDHADGLMFFCDAGYRRHEVGSDKDIDALLSKFADWESDQAVAYMERQMEGY